MIATGVPKYRIVGSTVRCVNATIVTGSSGNHPDLAKQFEVRILAAFGCVLPREGFGPRLA
jgi:hypothetical protein